MTDDRTGIGADGNGDGDGGDDIPTEAVADTPTEAVAETPTEATAGARPEAADTPTVDGVGRVTEVGAPEVVDTDTHTVATVVGGVLLLAVIVAALFGLGGVLGEASSGREVPVVVVPRLSDRPVAQAQAQLERLGLIVDIRYQANERVPVDVVVEQTPIAGARLEVGQRVVLGVSDGPSGVRVPDTVGQPVADATRLLAVVGLTAVPVERYDEEIAAGIVIASNPAPASRSKLGDPVELVVSKGPEPRIVPEVVGVASADGMVEIGRAELNVGDVTLRVVRGVDPGRIASVDPEVGAAVPRGTPVDVVISVPATPGSVPDLVGLRRRSAEEIADSLGIRLSVTHEVVAPTDRRAGLVISQSPVAESPLAGMSIVVAAVPAPTTTTTTAVPGSTTTTTEP